MHLLGILYGVFLVLLSLAPVYLAFRVLQLVRQMVADAAAKITAAIAGFRKRIDAVVTAIGEVKQALIAAGKDVEPLETSLAALAKASGDVKSFSSQITLFRSESVSLLSKFVFQIPDNPISNFIKFKTFSIFGYEQIPYKLEFQLPFTFGDLSLDHYAHELDVPGLRQVQDGFKELVQISDQMAAVLRVFADQENLIRLRQAAADVSSAGRALKSIVDLAQIEAEIAAIKEAFEAMIGLYRPKVLAIAWLTGAVVAAVYLNWAISNVTQAVGLIFG